ncbi:arginase family protein [soil metagenome]
MGGFAIIEAPSVLGLFPQGVEFLPRALLDAGLREVIGARHAGRVVSPPYDPVGDVASGMLNPAAIRDYSRSLADVVGAVMDAGDVPVVLGGDCSIVLGTLLALRRRGRYGLLFLDGHADFYDPASEPNGEAASMDLALATGRGPEIVTELEGYRPLVRDEDVVHVGRRDADEANEAGSPRIEDSAITVIDLLDVRRRGVGDVMFDALHRLVRDDLDGFWVHLDCDVLDDSVMPAVDYRLPGGLAWDELEALLAAVVDSGGVAGLEITILNPALDPDGSRVGALVGCLGRAFGAR